MQGPEESPGHIVALDAQRMLRHLQIVITLASMSLVIITAGLPLYSTEVGASGFEVGQLIAAGALMTAIARPIIGRALDIYGRKLFLLLGIGVVGISMVLFAASRNVAMLLFASTAQGFGAGTMLLSAYTMTADLTMAEGRAGGFGSTEQAQYRGGLYGGVLAIPILLFTGFDPQGQLRVTPVAWSLMFVLFAVATVAALLMAGFGTRETFGLVMPHEDPETAHNHNKINPQLYVLMAVVALTSASSSGIAPFILKFIQDHITQDVTLIALAYLPASIVWGFLPSRMGIFADRYGRKLPMAIGLTVSGVFSAVIPFITAIVPLMVFATVEAICYTAAVPAEQAMVADMTGGKQRGIGFGLYTLAMSVGRVVGPLVMGWLYDQFRAGPFAANAVILLIGTFLVLVLLRDPGRNRQAAKTGR